MQRYNCKNCGAELFWDSTAGCLKCEYCGYEYQASDFEKAPSDTVSPTAEIADASARATDHSDSTELVLYQCSHCGAEIVTAKSTVATTCAYCGRAITMTEKLVENFKPDVVIPFAINEKEAKEIYRKYIRRSFLTPKKFQSEGVLKKIKGLYVPFWLHSFTNDTNALFYGENVSSHRRGDDKIVEHHMYDISVEAQGIFTNIPTDALKNLDDQLMDAIEPFHYENLVEFTPAYMAGFYAEEYNETEQDTLVRATQRAKEAMLAEAEQAAGVYTVKHLQHSTERLSDLISRYAMFPVWLLHIEYKQQNYTFAINGETGKIAGKLPICGKRFTLAAILSFLSSCLLVAAFLMIGGKL